MEKTGIWDVLREGGREDLVLVVDYAVNGRQEAGFKDLVARMDSDHTFWETLAPPVGEEVGLSPEQYLDRWLDAVQAGGRNVSAVIGYCASSNFAGVIAEGVGRRQETPPKLVLLDPTQVTSWTILHFGFFKVLESLRSMLSEEEIMAAQREGWEIAQANENLEDFRAEIVALYRRLGETAFERGGLKADIGEQLVAWFAAYMAYLIASGAFAGRYDTGEAVAVCSSVLEETHMEFKQELRFDVDHTELLRTDEVAEAVAELLG
ncbi:hypothetical protein KMT30_01285 [Streptomyces sp. IBSBF 2953]|uniref:hypothetical protein n=1 Tax=Streptomyces TaxID=1883 RepID=UPI00211A3DDA|nr:hypothetical protein [Streptomyces scabiei]MCQ9177703.1 hypothetical protein [Streptomyces hayashii]MDX3115710.1 hypothetical protein [Streptomyces scabiei]